MGRFVYRVDFDLKSGREGWREHHYFHLEADTIKEAKERFDLMFRNHSTRHAFHRAVSREYGQIAEIGYYDAPYGYGSGHGTSRPLACNATEGWPR